MYIQMTKLRCICFCLIIAQIGLQAKMLLHNFFFILQGSMNNL